MAQRANRQSHYTCINCNGEREAYVRTDRCYRCHNYWRWSDGHEHPLPLPPKRHNRNPPAQCRVCKVKFGKYEPHKAHGKCSTCYYKTYRRASRAGKRKLNAPT